MTIKPSALYWMANPMEADLVRMVLTRAGYDSISCSELAVFRQIFAEKNLDLVILDIVLPDQNGLELIKTIKADSRRGNTPVILISALAFADVVVQARKAGAADFFLKPLDANLLFQRVSQLVKTSLSAYKE